MIAYQKKPKQTTKSRLFIAEMKHDGPAARPPSSLWCEEESRATLQLVLGHLTQSFLVFRCHFCVMVYVKVHLVLSLGFPV